VIDRDYNAYFVASATHDFVMPVDMKVNCLVTVRSHAQELGWVGKKIKAWVGLSEQRSSGNLNHMPWQLRLRINENNRIQCCLLVMQEVN